MMASVARACTDTPVHQVNQTNGYALEPEVLIDYVEEELS
jgi:hypothetical protein